MKTSQLSVCGTDSGKDPTNLKYLTNSTTLFLSFKITANSTNQITKSTNYNKNIINRKKP